MGIPLYYRIPTALAGCFVVLCGLFILVGQVAFAKQDVIVFTSNRNLSLDLYLIDTRLKTVYDLTFHSTDNFSPAWSPDGREIAFASRRNGLTQLFITDLHNNVRAVTSGNSISSFPQWSSEGHTLTYISRGIRSLRILLLDPISSETRIVHNGPPVPQSRAAWSPVQDTLAFSGTEGIAHGIYLIEENGNQLRKIASQRPATAVPIDAAWLAPSWSPDGTRIAYSSNGIQIIDVASGDVYRLTDGYHGAPSWSPDGQRIAFVAVQRGNWDIYSINVDGSELQRLTRDQRADFDPAWQPYD